MLLHCSMLNYEYVNRHWAYQLDDQDARDYALMINYYIHLLEPAPPCHHALKQKYNREEKERNEALEHGQAEDEKNQSGLQ